MVDVFFIIMVVITIAFWVDLIIPDVVPFIDEAILFILMIGGWILFAIYKLTTEGAKIVAIATHPASIMIIVVVLIGFAIWKFDLLGDPRIPKKKVRK